MFKNTDYQCKIIITILPNNKNLNTIVKCALCGENESMNGKWLWETRQEKWPVTKAWPSHIPQLACIFIRNCYNHSFPGRLPRRFRKPTSLLSYTRSRFTWKTLTNWILAYMNKNYWQSRVYHRWEYKMEKYKTDFLIIVYCSLRYIRRVPERYVHRKLKFIAIQWGWFLRRFNSWKAPRTLILNIYVTS